MHYSDINNLSSFLSRHASLFHGKRLLVCGQLQSVSLAPLISEPNTTFLISDYSVFNNLQTTTGTPKNPKLLYGFCLDTTEQRFDAVLLFMPKAKQEAALWLSSVLPWLKLNGEIFVIGENRGGISAAPKLLLPYTAKAQKLDSARHCSLFYAVMTNPPVSFVAESLLTQYSLPLTHTDSPLVISALPGVFSAKELDEGTNLLLDSLPELSGDILDIGCGAGVIGATVCQRMPDTIVTMTDINALALFSAKETLKQNNLTATVVASDMFSDIQGKFDFIISNPPFHAGLNTNYEATERFLRQAASYLKKEGQLILVANKFLRYEPILAEVFRSVSIIRENNRFKIIKAF